ILQRGFPREASAEVDIGGVRTNFRMPDVLSIGIGGGSYVGGGAVGAGSGGYEVTSRGLGFGGGRLAAPDPAGPPGIAEIGNAALVAHLDPEMVRSGLDRIAEDIGTVVDRMRTSAAPLPVVAVGGGSILVPETLESASEVRWPEHFAVANAIGAAI